jgi:cellulose synthase/poly-beta-1,6-N-acetylglucosamine synthase-like glycosyltransferase
LDPPFTISVTFGGGIAEAIGFSVGRRARILCPMLAYHHTLVLHVDANGRYVLLRDGHLVQPMDPPRNHYVPERISNRVELRLVLDNIDGTLVTQTILLWNAQQPETSPPPCDYSVVIVSARYARRLQAVLQSLVHQSEFDLSRLEIVIAYVPGIDPTDDVLDSIAQVHPKLRIVRAPFVDALTRSKGYLINEACKLARGEWVVLLDSDILVPPDLFAAMDRLNSDCMFAAPDGRKMLTPESTAKVLLGEIRPWEAWQSLLKEAGEFRFREVDGVPIGFFQAVRRACLEKVPYEEYEHFEGADWGFGKAMRDTFGMETRLPGPVLHLDHGGSKWYGTRKHF